MDHVNILSSFESIERDSILKSIFAAMVFCLKPDQACSFFDVSFKQEYKKRLAIMKKISHDIQCKYRDCHRKLLYKLMESIESLPSNKRQSCGYSITYLIEYIPYEDKEKVISFFLASQWKPIRNRGYKYLLQDWNDSWVSQIEENWNKRADFGAARLILEYFPESYLVDNFDILLPILENTYFIRKFYLKVVSFDSSKLNQIRRRDSITYTYILVKLNIKLDDNEALSIFEESKTDDRIGLLIWCFGQMGLWSVLQNIYENVDSLNQAQYQAVIEKINRSKNEAKQTAHNTALPLRVAES